MRFCAEPELGTTGVVMADMRKAFLADIIENIDDDTPRLVFADWLEENGDSARAEFIRLQCKEATKENWVLPLGIWHRRGSDTPRGTELLAEHGDEWMKEAPKWATKQFGFYRGFVSQVSTTGRYWQNGAAALCRRVPIEALELRGLGTSLLAELSGRSEFRHLRELRLWGHRCTHQTLSRFFATTELQQLRTLEYSLHTHGYAELNALLASEGLSNVRNLVLSGGTFGVERFTSLAASRFAPRLRSFGVNATRITRAAATAFARLRGFGGLQELSMQARNFEDEGVIELCDSPYLNQVQRLHLRNFALLTDRVVRAVASSPCFTRLTELHLDYVGPKPESTRLIAESESLIHLRRLRVNDDSECHDILARLAARRRQRGIK